MILEDRCEDRVAAITCAAYIERHIVEVIAKYFPGMTAPLKKAFFDETSGMVRAYGNKLDMARALDAITPGAYSDGKLIGRIRNKFAHDINVMSFEHEKVRDLVDQLQTGRSSQIDNGDGTFSQYDDGWDRGTRFRMVALGVCTQLLHLHIKEYPFSYSAGSSSIGTGERPPSLDKLSKPPRRD